jgi:hypothetical protein
LSLGFDAFQSGPAPFPAPRKSLKKRGLYHDRKQINA